MLSIAAFQAGALISMLMPILLLIVLVCVLYRFATRVPGGDASETRRATQAEHAPPAGASTAALTQPTGDPHLEDV